MTAAPKCSCNYCLGSGRQWSNIISSYDICPDCGGSGQARLKFIGDVREHVQMDGALKLCRIELWRHPDGERRFGKVLEVLS